ncbi:MAG: hypothetical protein AAGA32_07695 [Pseudomonadota bacterium]
MPSLPNDASIARLHGAALREQNDERHLRHRSIQIDGMADLHAERRPETEHTCQATPSFTV